MPRRKSGLGGGIGFRAIGGDSTFGTTAIAGASPNDLRRSLADHSYMTSALGKGGGAPKTVLIPEILRVRGCENVPGKLRQEW